MSTRRRRKIPATRDEARSLIRDVARLLRQLDSDHRWLVGSAYKPKGRKVDPTKLVVGTPEHIRFCLARAADGLDDAYFGAEAARYWLGQTEIAIDRDAPREGIDPELATLPEISRGELRQALAAQGRRFERAETARLNGDPYPDAEVTG